MSYLQPSTFERLETRYRYRAELVTVTGLRIGAGKRFDAAATDQPVMRDALSRPYIPGSSLKGSLRSGLEAILRGLDRTDLWACDIFVEPCVGFPEKSGPDKGRSQQPKILLKEVQEKICTACSLFGSPLLAGRVYVHDLKRLSGSATEIRDGVGIDRDLGTARSGVKYDTEVVPTGSRFELEMVFENVDPVRLGLILQTMELLHQGQILLGGLTTRGLGRVALDRRSLQRTEPKYLLDPPAGGDGPYENLNLEDETTQAMNNLKEVVRDSGGIVCTPND